MGLDSVQRAHEGEVELVVGRLHRSLSERLFLRAVRQARQALRSAQRPLVDDWHATVGGARRALRGYPRLARDPQAVPGGGQQQQQCRGGCLLQCAHAPMMPRGRWRPCPGSVGSPRGVLAVPERIYAGKRCNFSVTGARLIFSPIRRHPLLADLRWENQMIASIFGTVIVLVLLWAALRSEGEPSQERRKRLFPNGVQGDSECLDLAPGRGQTCAPPTQNARVPAPHRL